MKNIVCKLTHSLEHDKSIDMGSTFCINRPMYTGSTIGANIEDMSLSASTITLKTIRDILNTYQLSEYVFTEDELHKILYNEETKYQFDKELIDKIYGMIRNQAQCTHIVNNEYIDRNKVLESQLRKQDDYIYQLDEIIEEQNGFYDKVSSHEKQNIFKRLISRRKYIKNIIQVLYNTEQCN